MKALRIATLLIATIALAQTAAAEPLPFGCYVTDTERSWFETNCGYQVDCYVSSDGYYSWLTPGNTSNGGLIDAYGTPMATMIKLAYDNATIASQYDTAYKSQASLVKKLRKACGSKCKRIK